MPFPFHARLTIARRLKGRPVKEAVRPAPFSTRSASCRPVAHSLSPTARLTAISG